jgi:glycerol kinase
MVARWQNDKYIAEIETLAASVPDNGGVYFPALTGLGAPHWDQYARGAILGITRGTNAHIACDLELLIKYTI